MENCKRTMKSCCYGCLCSGKEHKIRKYVIKNGPLRANFKVTAINLCYLCRRLADRFSKFVYNVKNNQIFLKNVHDLMDTKFQIMKAKIQRPVDLSQVNLYAMELKDTGMNVEEKFVLVESNQNANGQIKIEFKQESESLSEDMVEEFLVESDDFPEEFLKEEEEYPLTDLFKEEISNEEERKGCKLELKVCKDEGKGQSRDLEQIIIEIAKAHLIEDENCKNGNAKDTIGGVVQVMYLTLQKYIEEKKMISQEDKYVKSNYKCEYCLKGYQSKKFFYKHMHLHSEAAGKFVCEFCTIRKATLEELIKHRERHIIRYKCMECDLIGNSYKSIITHYEACHGCEYVQHKCPHCFKLYNKRKYLRKHISYAHRSNNARVICAYCQKSYANKNILKSHIAMRHSKEISSSEIEKRYVCTICNMKYLSPSHLKAHSLKHSETKDFYCVECDKSFKTDSSLKQHFKTALSHVTYEKLTQRCEYCTKRFSSKRDLNKHMNRVHLKIKPYQCNQCEKAYVCSWSLSEHKKLAHEGYQPPLKYPCTMCNKVFRRSHILKSHIRTHTGEKPYQCKKCPAQFTQPGVLSTHVKLIHLKLTRDGHPKTSVRK